MEKTSLGKSFGYAWAGILYTIAHERNMQIHVLAVFTVIMAGVWFELSRLEWGLLSFTIALVLMMELINTAIERTIDLITDHYHPLARAAKNTAAGAVLISAINAIIMACIIFGPHLLKMAGRI